MVGTALEYGNWRNHVWLFTRNNGTKVSHRFPQNDSSAPRTDLSNSFWLFGGISKLISYMIAGPDADENVVFLWIFQVHCTLQIIINRIALLALSKSLVRRLKWGVFIFVLLINIAVACVWIPAQLQISQRYIRINDYWDHTEKILLAIIDVSLNLYFIYLVRSSLIAYGLVKYVRLYRFNVAMILLSMTMDVSERIP